jgi:heme/copper-type cytochrome/quinol oxidase subunit 2
MDELELLKKDWQANSAREDQKISSKDIYPMMQKKSSSIVKTLFYISIAELLFWIILNSYPYFASAEYRAELTAMYGGNSMLLLAITVFSYAIILTFVYLLYKTYRTITVTDNAKKLMGKILKTRKIIKYYVIYNLVMAFLSISFGLYYSVYNNPEIAPQFAKFNDKQMFVATVLMVLFTGIFVLVFWVFYRLIYGILLRRLNRNYKELKKLEV